MSFRVKKPDPSGLMVKQDARDCVQTIRIAVRPNGLMCRYLGYSIRAYWIKERLVLIGQVSTQPYISLLKRDRIRSCCLVSEWPREIDPAGY